MSKPRKMHYPDPINTGFTLCSWYHGYKSCNILITDSKYLTDCKVCQKVLNAKNGKLDKK